MLVGVKTGVVMTVAEAFCWSLHTAETDTAFCCTPIAMATKSDSPFSATTPGLHVTDIVCGVRVWRLKFDVTSVDVVISVTVPELVNSIDACSDVAAAGCCGRCHNDRE